MRPSHAFLWEKPLALTSLAPPPGGVVEAKPAKGNSASIFVFPWEGNKANAQISKESRPLSFIYGNYIRGPVRKRRFPKQVTSFDFPFAFSHQNP